MDLMGGKQTTFMSDFIFRVGSFKPEGFNIGFRFVKFGPKIEGSILIYSHLGWVFFPSTLGAPPWIIREPRAPNDTMNNICL